ncbi:MAG: hypothetical protein RR396_00155 [Clostridiales bacterium]
MQLWQKRLGYFFIILAVLSLFLIILAQGTYYFGLVGPFSAGIKEESIPDAMPVQRDDTGLFGNILLETEDKVSLPKAYLLINGQKAGDLAQGELLTRVYPNDYLLIDASAYGRDLQFYLKNPSSNLKTDDLPAIITMDNNGKAVIGAMKFK